MKQAAYFLFETPLGHCGIAWKEQEASPIPPVVTFFQLPEATRRGTEEKMAGNSGGCKSRVPPPRIAAIIRKVQKHLHGDVQDFLDIVVDLGGAGPFARQVYEAARKIPAGRTVTYGGLAADMNRPTAARAVGQALGRNPIPLIIPCHRVLAAGGIGSWHTGPTVLATNVTALGGVGTVAVPTVRRLDSSTEWHIVRVFGRISRVTHSGLRWRAELLVDGRTMVALGEPASGVPSDGLVAGRLAAITGVVRRSTSDSSAFQLLPRSTRDVLLGPLPVSAAAAGSPVAVVGSGGPGGGPVAVPRVEIGSLAGRVGDRVTVSGLVVESDGASATIADGTGEIRIGGADATEAISLLEPGDAVEVGGTVARDSTGLILEVEATTLVALSGGGASGTAGATIESATPTRPGTGPAGATRFLESPDSDGRGPGLLLPVGVLALAVFGSLGVTVARSRRREREAASVGDGPDGPAGLEAVATFATGAAGPDNVSDDPDCDVDGAAADAPGAIQVGVPGPLARWVRSRRA